MQSSSSSGSNMKDVLAGIVVKAWTDPDYASRLRNETRTVLQEEGVDVGEADIEIHFDTSSTKNIVIPAQPQSLSLQQDDLKTLASQMIDNQLELF